MNKNQKYKILFSHVLVLFFLVFVGACSTEKNTFINRSYHSVTAKYNGYFNAKELINEGMENYRYQAREDFSEILPIELFPNEEDVVNLYPIVDTAIVKCQTVISKHSMPTSSKPSQKKSEYAKWIDQNWLMIGYANYIRRDYQKALSNFTYVRKFYTNKPSSYTGHLWKFKTEMALNDMSTATRTMQKLDQRVLLAQSEGGEKAEKSKTKSKTSKNKSSKKDDQIPKLPKDFEFEYAKAKAIYALKRENEKEAIEHLRVALDKSKKKEDKARLSFILAQLLQKSNNPESRDFYTMSIKKNAPFEMAFNAKINRSLSSNLGDDAMIDELVKLSKEERYFEFRDQIYFAMAKIELGRQARDRAKYDLTKSAFYSINNSRQKGMSYEKLGDLTLEEKNYVAAQRYYDSSARVIPETYVNYDIIKNKAEKLSKLVENIEIIEYEDSMQMIAGMSESQREQFAKDVIKQLKKEEQERKEREAARAEQLRALQQTYAKQNQKTGSKWYFGNQKAMQTGIEDFKNVWGQRENEDYWRLSNKPMLFADINNTDLDTLAGDSLMLTDQTTNKKKIPLEELTPEDLLAEVPLSDSAIAVSNQRLLEALYNAGHIYQDQLKENQLASQNYQRVIDKNIEHDRNPVSAFQLYKINEGTAASEPYKDYIINNYPNSDYANYLRDPDYFVKKKERDALALKDYLRSVTNYEQGLFYPVIIKADQVLAKELDNAFREQYLLLKVMAMGRLNSDKTTLLPTLEQIIEEYPETETASRAEELIDMINNGIEIEELSGVGVDMTNLFAVEGEDYFVFIMLEKGQNSNSSANDISNFNNAYFKRLNLSSSAQLYEKSIEFIMVKTFVNREEAQDYIKDLGRVQLVKKYHSNEIFFISRENAKILLQNMKLEEYRQFYEANYN